MQEDRTGIGQLIKEKIARFRRIFVHKLNAKEISVGTIKEKVSGSGTTFDDVLKVDVINEKTGAAGVTADGVKMKDGSVVVADAGYIGSVSDTDAIQIEADGDVVLTQDLAVTGALTAASYGGITEANLVDKSASEAITGSWDFGGATQFEIPNDNAPTAPNADGEMVVDLSVSDWSHGLLEYYGGELMGVVAMPIAQFTNPTDNHVVTYNAATDEFELQAGGGGGQDLATDTLWAAAGDLVKGTGDDAADILSIGAANTVLWSNGAVPSWSAAPRLANIADTGGTNRLTPGATNVLTGNVQVSGILALQGSTVDTNVGLHINNVFTAPASWRGIGITPTITTTTNRDLIGVYGAVVHKYGASNTGGTWGLRFGVACWPTATGLTQAVMVACETELSIINQSTTASTITKVAWYDTRAASFINQISGTMTITNLYGLRIAALALSAATLVVSAADAIRVEDWTGTSFTTPHLLEIGSSTPTATSGLFRMMGNFTAAANETPIYISEGAAGGGGAATLRQLKTKDGAAIGGGDLVCVLV